MTDTSVGVIVPTLNRERQLSGLLLSLQNQSQPPDTIIVVNGGTDDNLPELSRRFGCTILGDHGPGDRRSHARNLGASSVSTGIAVFLDDDMEASDQLLEECRELVRGGAQAIVVPELTQGTGILGRVRRWERALVEANPYLRFPRAIQREVFVGAGGFDESLSGFEDLDLTATLIERGVTFSVAKARLIHHEENMAFRDYVKKRVHYTRGARAYRAKHPRIASEVFSPLHRLRIYASGIRSLSDVPLFIIATTLRSLEILRI